MEEKITLVPSREKIYIEYMGCPQRALDARRLEDYFRKNHLIISKKAGDADHIFFISCAFRNTDEDFAIKRIGELKKHKARLIIGGCLKAINPELLGEAFQGSIVPTSNLDQIDQLFPDFTTRLKEIPDANQLFPKNKWQLIKLYASSFKRLDLGFLKPVRQFMKKKDGKHYWHIRAAWGCVKEHCAYCSVWKAVGMLKSKPPEECVKELREGLRQGHKNILIAADNLGAYGTDIGLTLPDLLERLTDVNGSYALQLENVHPFFLIKYFDRLLPLFRRNKITALLCPIQSGSDRILLLMNRRHGAEEAKKCLLGIKEAVPRIELYTQIIVGFPSETEEELEKTLSWVRDIGFHFVHVSPYHKKKGLDLKELMNEEIPKEEVRRRMSKVVKFFKKNKIGYFTYPE